jgi:hypothetical protein
MKISLVYCSRKVCPKALQVVAQLHWLVAQEPETSFAEQGGMLLHSDVPCWRHAKLCLTSLTGLLMELLLCLHQEKLQGLEE